MCSVIPKLLRILAMSEAVSPEHDFKLEHNEVDMHSNFTFHCYELKYLVFIPSQTS